jgi:hypothetical protein
MLIEVKKAEFCGKKTLAGARFRAESRQGYIPPTTQEASARPPNHENRMLQIEQSNWRGFNT